MMPEKYRLWIEYCSSYSPVCIVWYIAPKCFSRLDVRAAMFKDQIHHYARTPANMDLILSFLNNFQLTSEEQS